ncbi:hypothetical protein BHE90_009323 [Fusarium euwallaceae]|uniref:Uncharacterized protein n=4 Tax=Fusarium solani species complex TaxID=232080 RepID=A0A3M2S510_9HYPO|nr:hypothetical protein CDV36_007721 [Fusarium kuroshium]RSL79256.1 hypothetical protein CEP51_007505 [Fusarium floridanum]RSM15542.1 hypothetical protein CEP52_000687 [Fusarium oligoseptatum]RTE76216.1 hypothetical protein BHE90_009323 [Fusarium euwallaceae]
MNEAAPPVDGLERAEQSVKIREVPSGRHGPWSDVGCKAFALEAGRACEAKRERGISLRRRKKPLSRRPCCQLHVCFLLRGTSGINAGSCHAWAKKAEQGKEIDAGAGVRRQGLGLNYTAQDRGSWERD